MSASIEHEIGDRLPIQTSLPDGAALRRVAGIAPIALFVYNRPWHARQTIEALQKNHLARDSDLFIYADAAKQADTSGSVQEVREYIKSISGFKSVNIIEQQTNLGLARSIIEGVTRLCDRFGRVIVLEDDLVSSPYFLSYMNNALDMYEDSQRVMHVSGSAYPVKESRNVNSYFLQLPLCWGWATWDRAWSKFVKNVKVMERFDRQMISRFNFDDTHTNFWAQLEANRDGRINTWFIFWYATVFLEDGLVLFPGRSLLRNIGMDGTGVHCSSTNDFDVEISDTPIALERIPLEVSREALTRHKKYFRSLRPTFRSRILRKVERILERVA